MLELLKYAFTGVNVIPTVLLGLVLLYWIIAIIGALDFDFLDIDLDLDGAEQGPFYGILAFLNVAELPFMLVFSLLVLIFWMLAMFMYYIPVPVGGLLNGLLFIPAIGVSMMITKFVTMPLKGIFKYSNMQDERGNGVIEELCTLTCNVNNGRLGQAKIKRDGASIVINVKSEFDGESFNKDEVAFVSRKDEEKNVYYIIKIKE
ncbi:hypothetical protein HZI73_07510 [Vallitalea pronyensis]|uniref:DUF1449 family protein n=1 Tax=Vallitalea pronyensis TaxID=1348613 RepID=A0A8J8MHY1_9FIRM|nr:hypothetical protein [Vallitalea pronyensis]QUI22157.1 hypothetical protein HZI73_07510 [Vallitalea pronyensis]